MLMPAPATPPDTDLYYVAHPRQGGLTSGVPRSDEDARREALAIERMLDLLADDELERGMTWVAFDNQRLFDLCATIVGRTLRLPESDPHRRLVVVGRGDPPAGDEGERRAGHRYRDAMRAAVGEGVPIERIQLLRGASLGWVSALTSRGMAELLARRADPSSIRLRVSLRQPHTASLLVGGDLERALATGETRHVRVALLIEAATVEPAGPTARVQVVRAGLVSTRLEVLTAAASMLRALREEHAALVSGGAVAEDPGLARLLADDRSIVATPDPEALAGLRDALYKAQIRLWCDQLRAELTTPVPLPTEADRGRWLARAMSSTGILDAEALADLAIRPDGAGAVADPERVRAAWEAAHDPDATGAPLLTAEPGPSRPPSPPQPLFARDVTGDDLERWVGWTRSVLARHVVPDTRGKDLDLAFRGADIRDRLARWFDHARALGAREPGDVRIVVAGDGLNPVRDRTSEAFPLYRAHRALLLDPNVHYLRIQHAQGTHLAWMKDFLDCLGRRPPSSRSVALQFEAEHGATVNVVLLLERDRGSEAPATPWTLDGWEVAACGVVLSDLESLGAEDYKVGLFTERETDRSLVNLELAHFGRAHCEGLLRQAGERVWAERGPAEQGALDEALVAQIARWIERVRVWRRSSHAVPAELEARGRWIGQRLGLADPWLSAALAAEMGSATPASIAARALWQRVPTWPGPSWIAEADAGGRFALRSPGSDPGE
jgi:hypothetical protein